jgi:hypothetical protein
MYSGKPENNVKWVRAGEIFGECWMHKPLSEIEPLTKYTPHEFIRGEVPLKHRYKKGK